MSWYTPDIKSVLGISGLLSFYGIVGMIIWLLPAEQFGYNNTYKIVTIALILLTMPFVMLAGYFATRRKKKEEAKEAQAKEAEAESSQKSSGKSVGPSDDISKSAEETVQFLKSSNLGSGKDAVYELPWYLVIGGPKSGKTSLSLASGLNFQTLPSQRQSELKFIRPTRNVDWRVTSDAVFIDTAGRYQLEGADEDEWAGLIETVKKYRPSRPLDGMVVSVNTEKILHSDDNEIEQMAKVLRGRIDEVTQRIKVRFPIYLVFTHADSIEGFRDSFSNSQKEGQNLGWGATIPIEKSENAHTLFDSEFDLLHTSVMKRRLMRLSAPFPPVRQLKIFNFPLHFGAARKKLGHFVSSLFRPNPFSENPFLRGFYFTAVPVNRGRIDGGQTMTNVGQTVGLSYFTEKLFREVILRDKDLVANFQAQKVGPPIMGWLLTLLGAFLVSAFLLGAGISLYQNKKLVDEAKTSGEAVLTMIRADKNRNPLEKNPAETRDEIDKIESLRESLAKLDKYEKEWQPLLKWFGLYSGNRIYHEKLLPIYYNAVEQRYKKPILKKLEDDLKAFNAGNNINNPNDPNQLGVLDKNFELFRSYLMLSQDQINPNLPDLGTYRNYAEPNSLYDTLNLYLSESKVSEESIEKAKEQLKFYFQQVNRSEFPSIKLDVTLVESTRKKLQAYPAWAKYYKNVTDKISREVPSQDADKMLAGNGGDRGVLTSTHTVKGVYTIAGYKKMLEAIDAAAVPGNLNKDDWVMGGNSKKDEVDPAAVDSIRKKYYEDYIINWKKFVTNINIKPYKNKDEAVNALVIFSDVNSPLKTLMEKVSEQTNLSAEPASNSWMDYFWNLFKSKSTAKKEPTPVETQFDALFKFTESKEGKTSQMADYGSKLGTLLKQTEAEADITKLELTDLTSQIQAQKGKFYSLYTGVEKNIDSLLGGFKTGNVGPDIGILLKKPFGNLSDLVGGGIKDRINKEWGDVANKAKSVEKGFPYDSDGEADLKAMSEYYGPGGAFSKFFDERLKKYFEQVNNQWQVKENSELKFNDDFVKYVNNAFRLRDTLFEKGAPSFAYELKIQKLNDALIEVTIDGQTAKSDGSGTAKFTFPAASGDTGVVMKFASTAETSSTSSSPSANSPSSNVNSGSSSSKPSSGDSAASSSERSYQGSWGLLKFFDAGGGAANKNANGEYVLNYKLGGKTVTVTVKASGKDLFDRSIFTARAPQSLLKSN
jgi:type VI secretion system IcmF/VasK family protein